jgi:uridine phosphorylase
MNASTFFIAPSKVRPRPREVFGPLEQIPRAPFAQLARWPPPMPARLRPTAPIAADAVLVGDPGRALLLAQELLDRPKMSNHSRGLWGYSGRGAQGAQLTIQATGMGGPSAALVLAELAGLGVRRAIRIGTCLGGEAAGELLLVERALAEGGSAASFGLAVGESVAPDPALTAALRGELGARARPATVASFDLLPVAGDPLPAGADAADLQTVAILARARALEVAAAAVLIAETDAEAVLSDEAREEATKQAGRAAATILSA